MSSTFTIADADPVDEGGTASFTITIDPAFGFTFEVSITYTGVTADLEDLGTGRPTRVRFLPGDTSRTLEVPIAADAIAEGEETFTVTMNFTGNLIQATGTINASTATTVAPAITTQPTDQSVTVGESATFTVVATGIPTPTYQWRKDGTAISGATSASYAISSAALTNAGDYTVVVTNTAGTVTSTAATLTVTPATVAPAITTQPTNQSVTVGETATFTVAATGTPTPTYQWRFEGTEISGATSASYTISSAASTDAGDYTVVVTNTAGEVTSTAATLTVTAAPPTDAREVEIVLQVTDVSEADALLTFRPGLTAPLEQNLVLSWSVTGRTTTSAASAADFSQYVGSGTVTIEQGQGAGAIHFMPLDDDVVEGDEYLTVTLSPTPGTSLPDGVTFRSTTATATIADTDEADLNLRVVADVSENDERLTFRPELSRRLTQDFVLSWEVTGGTASADDFSEYVGSGTVTIRAGRGGTPIRFFPLDDDAVEGPETLEVTISADSNTLLPRGVNFVTRTATATIADSDAPPAVTVTIGHASSVAENGGNAEFPVSLSQAVNSDVVLDVIYEGSGDNPVELARDLGADRPTTVTIEEGQTEATLTVPVNNDALVEGDETFTVTIREGTTPLPDGVTIDDGTATGTIVDNETGQVTLGPATLTAAENGTFTYTVSLSQAADDAVTVRWTATAESGDTATVDDDLDEQTGTVTFPVRNNRAQTFDIAVNDDDLDEDNETFTVTLEVDTDNPLPTGITIGTTNRATGTITDNDDTAAVTATVSIDDESVAENGGNAEFTVRLTTAVDSDVTLAVAYADGTATLADDLGTRPTTVTIDRNQTSATLLVPIANDPLVEGNEAFTVTLSEGTIPLPDGVTIGTADTATGTIEDDDRGTVSLSPAELTAVENGTFTYTVSLSAPADEAVVVRWTATAESGDTATVATDLQATTNTVTFAANTSTAQTFTIRPTNDNEDEDNETFTVTLGADGDNPLPTGVTIGTNNSSTATIIDDDGVAPTVTVRINDASASEGDSVRFTVSLGAELLEARTLNVAYTAGSASLEDLGSDRPTTLTLPAGPTTVNLVVPTVEDPLVEGDEDFTVTLSIPGVQNPEGRAPLNALNLTDAEATGTITDNDMATVSIAPEADTQTEGNPFAFEVRLSQAVDEPISVTWTAVAGTAAVQGPNSDLADGQDITGTATFTAGTTTAVTVPIATLDDDRVESEEAFTVTLTGTLPDGVDYGTHTATATITDNDTPAVNATVSIADADPVKEDAGPARFTVSLSRTVDSDVVLDITYAADTAGLEDLGSSRPGTVTIPANATTAIVAVPITDDPAIEEAETFTVTLSEDPDNPLPPEVDIADGTATGTIAFTPEPSILIEPRRTGAGTALRRHVGRFDRMTSTVVRNRLDDRQTRHLSGSRDLGDGALAMGGGLGDTNWGVWMDGAWAGLGGRSSGRQADIYGGVDYRGAGGDWLIGALVGHELADLDIGQATYEAAYTHFGLYGGGRLSARLLVDGALTYGVATPEVAQGSVSASYEAHRITARGALTGDFGLDYGLEDGVVKFQPQLGLLYAREQLGAFTDSVGGVAAREQLELGRVSAGPRVTWAFDGGQLVDGGQLAGGARGQWDFRRLGDGIDERVSGAVDVGLTLDLAPGVSLGIQGDVDGLGITDEFRSFGGKINLGIRF